MAIDLLAAIHRSARGFFAVRILPLDAIPGRSGRNMAGFRVVEPALAHAVHSV